MGLHLQTLEVESLFRPELVPDPAIDAPGDKVIAGDPDGVLDHAFKWVLHAGLPWPVEFPHDVDVLDLAVLCQHPEGSGIGGELVVGICKVRVVFVVEGEHGIELPPHLILDFRSDLVEEGGIL